MTFNCVKCHRLVSFLQATKSKFPDYFCSPVPTFGDPEATLLIVGLAPGMHGANRTGRPFTGDYAGILLYQTLFDFDYSNLPTSTSVNDGLILKGCKITNAVRCLPPQNKPLPEEVRTCNDYLRQEIHQSKRLKVILALGQIAHQSVLAALDLKKSDYPFGHNKQYVIQPQLHLISSYHCSRYNTQTKRLTTNMFVDVFKQIKQIESLGHE